MENVALHYRIEHASHVDYSKVDPVYCEVEGFGIRIEDNRVRFEMKEHYATVDSALEAVKPYIHSWERCSQEPARRVQVEVEVLRG